ncbi:hypothetical protein AALO_G00098820 [Alosa alosa]|uniref:TNF family profile domain-containing protein n=1 Tax=Alosa alosa TaxID=278164 RepID=A0AAV6GYF0_9TELE|nr:hypothetical protein AALO_G00098820 [Alosa alosa]
MGKEDMEGAVFVILHRHKFIYFMCLMFVLLSEGGKCKSRNFGYLRPIPEILRNYTMQWEAIEFGNISLIGRNLKYDSDQGTLAVKQGGSYFFHLTLHFTSTALDTVSSRVNVTLESATLVLLSCEVELPAVGQLMMPVTKTCWAVRNVKRDSRLCAQMIVHSETDNVFGWKLLSNGSGFLIHRVYGP